MKTSEAEIHESLIALHAGIRSGSGPDISVSLARLDEVLARDLAALPAQLAHYLERRSYAKALAWFNGESAAEAPRP